MIILRINVVALKLRGYRIIVCVYLSAEMIRSMMRAMVVTAVASIWSILGGSVSVLKGMWMMAAVAS